MVTFLVKKKGETELDKVCRVSAICQLILTERLLCASVRLLFDKPIRGLLCYSIAAPTCGLLFGSGFVQLLPATAGSVKQQVRLSVLYACVPYQIASSSPSSSTFHPASC